MRHTSYEPGTAIVESGHTATGHGLTTTTEAARNGSTAGVALLRAGDPEWKGSKGFRAEWHGVDAVALDVERWHGISYLLPADWHQGENSGFGTRIVFQFHTTYEPPGWSPIYGLRVAGSSENPTWVFYRKDRYTRSDGSNGYRDVTLWQAPAQVGEWTDFVIHVRWTTDNDGYIQLYRNRSQVFSAQNIRTMNDAGATAGAYAKWGIYGQPTRILFDEVRIAEGPNQLDAVSP